MKLNQRDIFYTINKKSNKFFNFIFCVIYILAVASFAFSSYKTYELFRSISDFTDYREFLHPFSIAFIALIVVLAIFAKLHKKIFTGAILTEKFIIRQGLFFKKKYPLWKFSDIEAESKNFFGIEFFLLSIKIGTKRINLGTTNHADYIQLMAKFKELKRLENIL